MTVLMHDAVQQLSKPAKDAYEKGDLADLTFADDTLLLGVSAPTLKNFSELYPSQHNSTD